MASPLSVQVATRLITENNWQPARKIIGDGLDRGIIKGTLQGQVGALDKLYNNGLLPEVGRDEQQRPYLFYIKGSPAVHEIPRAAAEPVTFRPTSEQEEILKALIETRRCSNRSEAVNWLLNEGILSKQGDVRKILGAYREIERLRREAQQI